MNITRTSKVMEKSWLIGSNVALKKYDLHFFRKRSNQHQNMEKQIAFIAKLLIIPPNDADNITK